MNKASFTTIDEYISLQPKELQEGLQKLRVTILKAAPKATEVISYNMPAFNLNGILVYFAGCKSHYGFYPTPKPIVYFKEQLKDYKTSKGAIQFPVNKPLPVKLITQIVQFRIQDNEEKLAKKQLAKQAKSK